MSEKPLDPARGDCGLCGEPLPQEGGCYRCTLPILGPFPSMQALPTDGEGEEPCGTCPDCGKWDHAHAPCDQRLRGDPEPPIGQPDEAALGALANVERLEAEIDRLRAASGEEPVGLGDFVRGGQGHTSERVCDGAYHLKMLGASVFGGAIAAALTLAGFAPAIARPAGR